MAQGRPAEDSLCPLDVQSTKPSRDAADGEEEEAAPGSGRVQPTRDVVAMETSECSDGELGQLDLDLDRKSRQHNLTSRNVRDILHEVITHERVVAMMKATIRDTQDLPMFEAKMTRSRLKQAVQQGQSLNWTLPAPNLSKPPQFVDIDLEEDEDSSDEEYCPDEEEEDTAEEMFLSDADSLASPPRMHLCSPPEHPDQATREPQESVAGQVTGQVSSSSLDSSFLERLNAVEAELDCSSAYPYDQPLDRKPVADEEDGGDKGSLAFRTRSKLPLVNVPLDRLEAELLPPDITADMYDQSPAQLEDRHWTQWLQGLLAPSPEEEADDDDDPEYNFLEDLDEPDQEDYRTDRAVQITKKEVNELLEELFDTLQEEELPAEEEEQEVPSVPKFNVPQVLRFEAPLAGMLTERRQTVRKQYEAVQQRRALQDATNQPRAARAPPGPLIVLGNPTGPALRLGPAPKTGPSFRLDRTQKLQLQQQVQQHVQLLTQVHLLSRRVQALNHEAHLTKRYLEELQQFAGRHDDLCPPSHFRACNLQGALDLLREVDQRQPSPPCGSGSGASRRLLPTMTPTTSSHAFPLLPADTAWLFATRPVFLYPELLPVCSLDPALLSRRQRRVYTAGEDGLAVLGLKHFQGALQADQLISSFLLCRSCSDFRRRIRELSGPRAPQGGVIKVFVTQGVVPPLPVACSRVCPGNQRPPVDRDTSIMPRWLKNSQSIIQRTRTGAGPFPPSLPPGVALRLHPSYGRKSQVSRRTQRRLFTLAHNASLLPLAKAPAGQAIGRSTALPLAAPRPSPSPSLRQDVQQKPSPTMVVSAAAQQLWTLSSSSQQAAGPDVLRPIRRQEAESCVLPPEEDKNNSSSSLSPFSSSAGDEEEEEEEVWSKMAVGLKGGARGGRGGAMEGGGQERTAEEGEQEELDGDGEEEEEEDEGREDRRGEREDNGDKDRRGDDEEEEEEDDEEEEEEDFDDLTQDEDEEEVMSSASEESVLSVPELQETMKQLTWLAAERRLCDGDSEDDPSSQEDEDEEDDEAKGEEPAKGRSFQTSLDKDTPSGDKTTRGRRSAGRGRGRSRPLRGLARTRLSKDASKLSLLYDEKLLDNDPLRDSKDAAFAQSYLNRVREALQDSPGQVQEFVSLLAEFEQAGDGQEVTRLFRKLRCILGEHTDLLRDFAAFLHPEQALQCGLLEEQQAFERSRRFLRQLEISFGDNPTHYHKIIRALQTGPDPSPAHIQELKVQMAALLRGHTHLQAEFWVFFDDLRPPAARPEQFEEAHLPEEGDGAEGGGANGQVSRGGAGFEEVTLPDLEEEEEGPKIPPIRSRRQRRKMESHRSYKGSDWLCLCHDASISRHRRKRCSRCHDIKTSPGVSRALKSLDPLYAPIGSAPDPPGDTQLKGGHGSPRPDQSAASWEGFSMTDEKEEEEEQLNDEEQESPTAKRRREEELRPPAAFITSSSSVAPPSSSSPRPSLPPDLPVCAKNISLTASGEKVILWTREADRVILTMCQQEGANQNTFQAISNLLGNKTPSEVSQRFRDLMRLFRTAARHATTEEEAPPTDPTANETAD